MDGVDPLLPPGGYGGTGEGYCSPYTSTCDPFGYFGQEDKTMVSGIAQETCRDLEHVQMGFDSIFTAAETARIQGMNLYQQQATRIVTGLEFVAKYLNQVPPGTTAPPLPMTLTTSDTWLCANGTINILGSISHATVPVQSGLEIAYNEFANREGLSLPQTQQLVLANRPLNYNATRVIAWQTLTHANVGSAGIP
jgi:hypothetical protein